MKNEKLKIKELRWHLKHNAIFNKQLQLTIKIGELTYLEWSHHKRKNKWNLNADM